MLRQIPVSREGRHSQAWAIWPGAPRPEMPPFNLSLSDKKQLEWSWIKTIGMLVFSVLSKSSSSKSDMLLQICSQLCALWQDRSQFYHWIASCHLYFLGDFMWVLPASWLGSPLRTGPSLVSIGRFMEARDQGCCRHRPPCPYS